MTELEQIKQNKNTLRQSVSNLITDFIKNNPNVILKSVNVDIQDTFGVGNPKTPMYQSVFVNVKIEL
jgi:hypothetical protein